MIKLDDIITIDGVTYRKVSDDVRQSTLTDKIEDLIGVEFTKDAIDSDGDDVIHVEFNGGADLQYRIDSDGTVALTIGGWYFGANSIETLINTLKLIKGELV
jgi:hypothetical protein